MFNNSPWYVDMEKLVVLPLDQKVLYLVKRYIYIFQNITIHLYSSLNEVNQAFFAHNLRSMHRYVLSMVVCYGMVCCWCVNIPLLIYNIQSAVSGQAVASYTGPVGCLQLSAVYTVAQTLVP